MSKKKQILVTTHSPFFYLQGKKDDAKLYYVCKSQQGSSNYNTHSLHNIDEQMGLMPLVAPYIEEKSKALDELKKMNEDLNNKLSHLTDKIFVIPEGKTDVKHIEMAFSHIKNLNQDILDRIEYFDFNNTQTLGNAELKKMLEYVAKSQVNNNIIIGIFDRDDEQINNWLNQSRFLNLGNSVYACLIPYLENNERKKGDKICIEHYYTDDEITKKLNNNKKLYLGKEFDLYGKSNDDNFVVISWDKRTETEKSPIKLFSSDKRELQVMRDAGKDTLASKDEFAEYVKNNPDKFHFESFRAIFDLIAEIVENANNSSNNT
ncbi:MAG: hypothetical protein J6M43_00580 [Neisseriaceae bacterium]|nr:hypothetical protein [Neisseriaceae bacterium]